jgi:hypothetical protein
MPLSEDEIEAIAAAVYRRLVGGSVGMLDGPSAGATLDAIHSADLSYTFDADVAADSTLSFTIKRDVADELPELEILSGTGLTLVAGVAAAYPADGVLTRLSATQCRAKIRARSLVLIPPGAYVVEFRELATGNVTKSKHEIALHLRRSASRRLA